MRLTEICFTVPVLLPDGRMGNMLSELRDGVKITREGDTVVVEAHIPENEVRGLPVAVVRDYNWAIVAYSTRAAVPKAAEPAKK